MLAQNSMNDPKSAAVRRALSLMTEALDIIDASGKCPEAAAHLDLALRRLRERLSAPPDSDPPH